MKKRRIVLLLLVIACTLSGCMTKTVELDYYDEIGDGYNPTLFYENKITEFGADPGAIYIDDESDQENYGYFYLYPTSDYDASTRGIVAYKSKDLVNWEAASLAFLPEKDSYGNHEFWAPEVIFDKVADRSAYGLGEGTGVYYMFYSSNDKNNPEQLVFATHAQEKAYKAVEARIGEMSLSAMQGALAGYRNSEDATIRLTVSDYEFNAQSEGADETALAREALLKIETADIEYWKVRNDYGIGIAVSTSPAGPFVQYTRENPKEGERTITIDMPFLSSEDMTEYADGIHKVLKTGETGFTMIDPHPYVDPNTGTKYLYFVRRSSRSGIEGNFICGIEMGDSWTDDPKWETLTRLTSCRYTTAFGDVVSDTDVEEYLVNEGPFVYYQDGTYFLTYSVGNYNNTTYSVCQAIADSPLGEFRKLSKEEGGYILTADGRDDVSAPGHHSFVYYKDEIYIVYHAHWDTVTHTGQRGFAADRIYLTKNNDGQLVMQCNGPTATVMPLIGKDMEYKNIAQDATVTATKCKKDTIGYLNDGEIAVYSFVDFVKEFESTGESKITMTFDDYRTVRALMVFNSKDSDRIFHSIEKIELYYEDDAGGKNRAVMKDIRFDEENLVTELGVVTRCASAIAEFDELRVNKIVFTFHESTDFNISEIFVLGK